MRLRPPAGVILVLLVAGCAAPAAAPVAPPPPALEYRVPAPPTVAFEVGDSARVELTAVGQSFALQAAAREVWRMELATLGDGMRVTATLTDLDARVTNPLTAPQTADESTVEGPVVFTLDRRGRGTLESVPVVTPAVAQFLNGASIAHAFFPRVPGRAVAGGDGWVDTVSYSSEEAGARMDVRTVTSYTVAGDSVVDGATLLLVRSTGTTEQQSSGTIGGTSFSQGVAGATRGFFLWDLGAGLLHSVERSSDLSGRMEVAVAPVPLAVRVVSTVRIRRVPER